ELDVGLLRVVRLRGDRRDFEAVRGLHVRGVVEAADEGVGGDVHRALDVAVAAQREVGEPAVARGHAYLHGDGGGRHREVEGVLELYLLRLGQPERARDVGEGLAGERDGAG